MSSSEEEKRKREIFEAMSLKRQERILKKGYENWDPFQKPKEPFEQIKAIKENSERALEVSLRFLAEQNLINPRQSYTQGVIEICRGLLSNDERYLGMFDFCLWYVGKKQDEKKPPQSL